MKHSPLLLCALLASCSAGTDPSSDLEDARARWRSAEPTSYEFTMQRLCFCPRELTSPVIVQVKAGLVESRRYADTGGPVDARWTAEFPAIDGVFAIVDAAIARRADKIDAVYDPTRGFPTRIDIDYISSAADDELGVRVRDFKPRTP